CQTGRQRKGIGFSVLLKETQSETLFPFRKWAIDMCRFQTVTAYKKIKILSRQCCRKEDF
ncbi:MAG: hypothetical protein LUC45_07405, partial [Paraprevotella sp.]|nr:hypothetical protein [Paraprevotella sp.]